MFSERYSVREKYNLITQEHISTCEQMPVRFTSLADSRYGPAISNEIKEKINRYVTYKPQHTVEFMADHDIDLFIEYVDGQITSYFVKNFMRLSVVRASDSLWNGYLNKIGCTDINKCIDEILRVCDVTDDYETAINGIEFDANGDFSGVRIFDREFNLVDYTVEDTYAEKIDKYTFRRNDGVRGADSSITFFPDSDKIKYTMNFLYPSFLNTSYNEKERVNRLYNPTKDIVQQNINALSKERDIQVITKDQADFIRSLCVGDSYFNLTWIINKSGVCEDIFLYHHTVHDFKDLTAS